MLEIRISNYHSDGTEFQTDWNFEPLKDKSYPLIQRESGASTGGVMRRRPYAEQEVREITFGASLLISSAARAVFVKLLRAHKIEFASGTGTQKKYTEYVLDAETEIAYDYLEDITALIWKELKFIEKSPRWQNTWYS